MTIHELGQHYAHGNKAHNECPIAKFQIEELNKELYYLSDKHWAKIIMPNRATDGEIVHDCRWCQGVKRPFLKERNRFVPDRWELIKHNIVWKFRWWIQRKLTIIKNYILCHTGKHPHNKFLLPEYRQCFNCGKHIEK